VCWIERERRLSLVMRLIELDTAHFFMLLTLLQDVVALCHVDQVVGLRSVTCGEYVCDGHTVGVCTRVTYVDGIEACAV